MNIEQNKYLQLSFVVLLCLLVEYICFGRIFYSPNDMSFAFGGDALFLYFNTTYHTCHGSGIMLESMNYPFGESIFMTDAQGALSIVMSTLNNLGIDTCTYSIGIINGLIMYLLPLCAIFLFLIFRRFKLNVFYAITVSVAITIMAPQTFRIVSHYGLSYPFYIPMCIYWVLRKFDVKRWEWKDVFFIITAAFFYLNNPYVGFAGLLFIPIVTLIKFFKSKTHKSFFFQYFGVTSFIVLLGYAIIKITDPFINRIKEQNGFFDYDVTLNGMLNSKYGFTNKLVSKLVSIPNSGYESTVNFGLIPFFTLLMLMGLLVYYPIRKKPIQITYPSYNYRYILLGALLLSFIACNGIIPHFIEEYIKSNLSSLLLFKATGRFIWLAYFSIAIWSAWWLHTKIVKRFSRNIGFGILIIISSIWMWESINGFYQFNADMSKHGNMFKRTTQWKKYLTENDINPEDYQAILALPIMQGWASKLRTELHWRSQYESTTMSLTSGLPLVDGMLSRMSLDHAMNIVQLGSHPLIDKKLTNSFPNNKPILVMDMSESESLFPNEEYLLSRSKALTKYKHFDMYRLEIDSLRFSPLIDSVQYNYSIGNYSEPIYYDGFVNKNLEEKYRFDKGSFTLDIGEDQLVKEVKLNTLKDSVNMEVSLWTLFTPQHEHTPKFIIQSLDRNRQVIQTNMIDSQFSKDVSDNWVRISSIIEYSKDINSIRILSTSKKEEIVDNVIIRYHDSDVVVEEKDLDLILWNNYLIKKQ